MPSFEEFVGLIKEGWRLVRNLANETKATVGRALDSNFVHAITGAIAAYFAALRKYALILAAAAVAPLVVVIPCLMLHKPFGFLYAAYAIWAGLIAILGIILFYPVVVLARLVKRLLPSVYDECVWPFLRMLDVLHIAISLALFAYIFPIWNNPGALPILLLVALAWLLGPWMAYGAKLKSVFVFLRTAQLLFLLTVTLLTIVFPVPMKHLQWHAGRSITAKIRPFQQKEITAEWETIVWFTPEGEPNVWYSRGGERGYRLFSVPGFDPDSNTELLPVDSPATKARIFDGLRSEKLSRIKAEQETAQKQAVTDRAAQTQRETASKQQRIREYVSPGKESSKASLALVVLTNKTPDPKAATWLAGVLATAGVATDPNVFSPAFASSNLFQELQSGHYRSSTVFNPADYCGRLLVAEISVTPGKEAEPVEMVTSSILMKLRVISGLDGALQKEMEIKSKGAGFKEADASRLAYERAEKPIVAQADQFKN